MTNTLGIMLEILGNYPGTRLSVKITGAIKRQLFSHGNAIFDNSNLSHARDICDRYLESCNMLFWTWSQAHAYDPSNYMKTRLKSEYSQRIFINDLIDSKQVMQSTWQTGAANAAS